MRRKKPRPRFPGLKLKDEDRELLRRKARERLIERIWKRIGMLQMLDEGHTLVATAAVVGSVVHRFGGRESGISPPASK
jgi:hypothetical protein